MLGATLVLTGVAPAQVQTNPLLSDMSTRALTMGENSTVLHDQSNIWMFPSRINNYPDLAVAEFGYPDAYVLDDTIADDSPFQRLGVHWKFNEENPWVLATYFHNRAPFDNTFLPIDLPLHGPMVDDEASYSNHRMDLFYGRVLGKNDFGFHFGYVHSSWKLEAPSALDELAYSQYNIDVGLTMAEGALDLAAGVELYSFTDLETQTQDLFYVSADDAKSKGNHALYARCRYFYEYGPTYVFVPHAELALGKYEFQDYDWNSIDDINELDFTRKYTTFDVDVGVGMQYLPITDVIAVLDAGVRTFSVRTETRHTALGNGSPVADTTLEYKETYYALPYFKLGFEADVFQWLYIRLGGTTYWTKATRDNISGDYKVIEKYPYNQLYLGLGFNWKHLHVDCYTDPELFLNGLDFISGSGSDRMNFQMTVWYEMI